MNSQFALFKERRFWPFFLVQCGGAFNDNLMKSAVVVLIAYGLWDVGSMNAGALVAFAAALFILPFILFCPLAGDLTDKYSKNAIIRTVKIAEVGIVLFAIPALLFHSTALSFIVLLALGTHSAFFSPAKFAILPQHLKEEELIAGNGLVGSGTYLSILMGTIAGTLLAPLAGGIVYVAILLLMMAGGGLAASFLIPPAPPPAPDHAIKWNPLRSIRHAFIYARSQKPGVFPAILGVSWFYFVASGFHAQFPNFAKAEAGVDTNVLSLFMILFSLGIAAGGMLNHRLLKGEISTKFVPFAMLSAGLAGIDLCMAAHPESETLITLPEFIATFSGWRILADLFILALAGGLYVIPLRALVQARAKEHEKARVVAANSMIDALLIFSSSLIATIMLAAGFSVLHYFTGIALACLAVAAFFFRKGHL
ncbi:MAG: MFS transporter [Alphaproteobacteria bacterium]|nr:MFS transporter [Alphaproteobacteria bacterium]MCD8520118.1 MFS transporter [Alphaproteobacteria bacterium]MCD8525937.1 MFS transporter [Alphaproteobacteria bacterium]MCD8571093.1 MFS transporter [Alphaproteobacteria bacterium]